MRLFEILLLTTIIFFTLDYLTIKKLSKKISLSLISFLLISHLVFEGYRWQMLPTYFLFLLLTIIFVNNYKILKYNLFFTTLKILSLSIILFISFIIPNFFPVFNLPKNSGKFKIGSDYFLLKTNREEIITKNTNDKRELMLKVWYPAKINNEKKENYLNEGDRKGFAKKYGLPASTFNYLDFIETNTYEKPEVASGNFPVLIFSHGSYSKASGYYAILEEIASHGYIIFNINHTYESVGSIFPDNKIIYFNKKYDLENVLSKNMTTLAWESQLNFNNAKSEKEKLKISKKILTEYVAANITKRWSKDISDVINNLKKWNENSFLKRHLNLKKIGVIGHSQGGSATGQAIIDDSRISVGINLDGVQWGNIIDTTFTKPFLYISSDWDKYHPNFNKYAYRNMNSKNFYKMKIENSGHASFMDIPLLINIPKINEAGSINPLKGYSIINKKIISFLNTNLK